MMVKAVQFQTYLCISVFRLRVCWPYEGPSSTSPMNGRFLMCTELPHRSLQ